MQGNSTFDEFDPFHLAEDLIDMGRQLMDFAHAIAPGNEDNGFGAMISEDGDFCAFIDAHPELRDLADLDFPEA